MSNVIWADKYLFTRCQMSPWLANIYLSDVKFVRCRADTSSDCACPTTDFANRTKWLVSFASQLGWFSFIISISGGHFLQIWRKIKGPLQKFKILMRKGIPFDFSSNLEKMTIWNWDKERPWPRRRR